MQEVIQKAMQMAVKEIEETGLPLRIHFDSANEKGQELAEKLGADKEVVLLGTMLMDVKIGQANKEGRNKEHVAMSAAYARELLAEFNLPAEKVKKVLNCIEAHHKDVPFICKEAEICANADCYRMLVPKNLFLLIAAKITLGWSLQDALNFAYYKVEEKHNILTLEMCKKELESNYQMLRKLFEALEAKPVIK